MFISQIYSMATNGDSILSDSDDEIMLSPPVKKRKVKKLQERRLQPLKGVRTRLYLQKAMLKLMLLWKRFSLPQTTHTCTNVSHIF